MLQICWLPDFGRPGDARAVGGVCVNTMECCVAGDDNGGDGGVDVDVDVVVTLTVSAALAFGSSDFLAPRISGCCDNFEANVNNSGDARVMERDHIRSSTSCTCYITHGYDTTSHHIT